MLTNIKSVFLIKIIKTNKRNNLYVENHMLKRVRECLLNIDRMLNILLKKLIN